MPAGCALSLLNQRSQGDDESLFFSRGLTCAKLRAECLVQSMGEAQWMSSDTQGLGDSEALLSFVTPLSGNPSHLGPGDLHGSELPPQGDLEPRSQQSRD